MDAGKLSKIEKIRIPEKSFTRQNHALCFLPGDRTPHESAGAGLLAEIQECLKRFGKLYYFLIRTFAPVMLSPAFRRGLKTLLKHHGPEAIILNIGSGPEKTDRRDDIINVDIFAFSNVDIVADASDLPILENSVDAVVNTAMLEHVPEPELIIQEMHRILKKNGEVICYLPFMQPFHAAPYDFHRWTKEGVKNAFSMFATCNVLVGAGPTSGMLWVMQEWLAILFSFGSRKLHDAVFLLLMVLTAPIKLLDLVMVHFPHAEKIASGFIVYGKK